MQLPYAVLLAVAAKLVAAAPLDIHNARQAAGTSPAPVSAWGAETTPAPVSAWGAERPSASVVGGERPPVSAWGGERPSGVARKSGEFAHHTGSFTGTYAHPTGAAHEGHAPEMSGKPEHNGHAPSLTVSAYPTQSADLQQRAPPAGFPAGPRSSGVSLAGQPSHGPANFEGSAAPFSAGAQPTNAPVAGKMPHHEGAINAASLAAQPHPTGPPSGVSGPPHGVAGPPAGVAGPPSGVAGPPSGVAGPPSGLPTGGKNAAKPMMTGLSGGQGGLKRPEQSGIPSHPAPGAATATAAAVPAAAPTAAPLDAATTSSSDSTDSTDNTSTDSTDATDATSS